jgi:hypothetical protein
LSVCRSKLEDGNVFLAPAIPRKKAEGAIEGYACSLVYEDIVALVDDTVFGKADDGLIVSRKGLFAHEFGEPVRYMPGADLKAVKPAGDKLLVNGAEFVELTTVASKSMAALAELIAALFGLPHPSRVHR